MLLQRDQAKKVGLFFGRQGWVPNTNFQYELYKLSTFIYSLEVLKCKAN